MFTATLDQITLIKCSMFTQMSFDQLPRVHPVPKRSTSSGDTPRRQVDLASLGTEPLREPRHCSYPEDFACSRKPGPEGCGVLE